MGSRIIAGPTSVHYQEHIRGVTKMTRVFANGLRMLEGICWHAWHRLEG